VQRIDGTIQLYWDSIIVSDELDEEGRVQVPCENEVYCNLGLNSDDEAAKNRNRDRFYSSGTTSHSQERVDIDNEDHHGDEECEDYIPDEKRVVYNRINPSMQPGCLFPNMKEFRIAMHQYAIKHEFELGIDVTSTTRYVGYCKGDDCPWRIYAREEKKGLPTIVVVVLNDVHTCTSSGRRKTTTPTSGWVAFHAKPLLMKKPHMGAKELQQTLQGSHNVTIGYDTVWKGKERP
jgi:hypothetical protein